ncbi:MAG: 3'(2'),5'-bisphosphate nucleotidase CysQ [Gammaproteobacteria bacterium]|nr:3'(2'),5'-bisphosphate nucleotidase CysQ [Gammaproteobacteria bacterium]
MHLVDKIIPLAEEAAEAILKIYRARMVGVIQKADNSPLTEADIAAHRILERGLQKLTPQFPVLSEESAECPWSVREKWSCFWLIDPLDGTKEFIRRSDEFSINIAFVEDGKSVMGVVYLPVSKTVYVGEKGKGAYKQEAYGVKQALLVVPVSPSKIRVVASRSHPSPKLQFFLNKLPGYELSHHGSAVKMCLIAEGKADIYPRFGPTSEWDTAAAQSILEEAGGMMVSMKEGATLTYNTQESLINPDFFAVGDKTHPWMQYF